MQYKSKASSRGFTIVELLIVIVIIGVLAALVIVAYNGIQNRARDTKRVTEVRQIQKILAMYHADNGEYPPVGADNTSIALSTLSPYLSSYTNTLPNDSTYPYVYAKTGTNAYGIRLYYEGAYCKTGVNINSSWWGVPVCSF